MRVLVTGGSGRLGTFIVKELIPDCAVVVLDRVRPLRHIEWIEADMLEREFGALPTSGASDLYEREPRASIYDIATTTERLGWRPRARWADVLERLRTAAFQDSTTSNDEVNSR